MVQTRVSILGAGPSGFALAADLESRGIHVLVYSHPLHLRHTASAVRDGHLTSRGLIEACTALRVTTAMPEAVAFSRTLILTVPSTAHATLWQQLKDFDLRQHTMIAIPGNLFSLVAATQLNAKDIFETNISPYSCRIVDGDLHISGKKQRCSIASLSQSADPLARAKVQRVLPLDLHWSSSVVEVCLSNINAVFHPLMVLMNAGRIESSDGAFLFYYDGLTRSVANAIEAVDAVRVQIGAALGLRLRSVIEVSNDCYGQTFTDLVDLATHSPPHKTLMAPPDLDHRSISEDVGDLLVCWHGLAEKLGIDAKPLLAVIVLAGMATGTDYLHEGRTLAKLGLQDISREELLQRFSVPLPQSNE